MTGIFNSGTPGDDTILGIAAADTLLGQAGNDTIDGSGWNDDIEGGPGADDLNGGTGANDGLLYRTSPAGVRINLQANTASGGDADGDTIQSFERVVGSDFDDTLVGSLSINRLIGRAGNDSITGGGRLVDGFDYLDGGAGADTIDGGDGSDIVRGGRGGDDLDGGFGVGDILSYARSFAAVTVDLSNNTASGGDANGDTIRNFEYVRGSSFDDTLTGDDGANLLEGFQGRDSIDGGRGNDTLIGGTWADTLRGGFGRDEIEGGAGGDDLDGGRGRNDGLSYRSSSAAVTVNLVTNTASGGHATGDNIKNFERVLGSDFGDTLTGSHGNDRLFGQDGRDRLFGRDGDDTLTGGQGSDVLNGGRGIDSVNGGPGDDIGVFAHPNADGMEIYDGKGGHDTLRLNLSFADGTAARSEINAYLAHIDAGRSAEPFDLPALGLTAVNWEAAEVNVAPGTPLAIFNAELSITGGMEPFVTDGTGDGTTLLANINPSGGSFPAFFEVFFV